MNLQPEGARRFLHLPQCGVGCRVLAGLTSNAMRAALGTSSCRSASRFEVTSWMKN